jgi:hypothetical protein
MCRDVPRPDAILRPRSARRVKGAALFLARRERSHAQKIGAWRFSSMASTGPLTCLSTVASPQRARASASVEDEHKGRSDYQLKGPAAPQSLTCRSIAAEAAWRLDADEIVEIELDDGLQGGAGGGVTQIVWQDVIPGGVFGLQAISPATVSCQRCARVRRSTGRR